MGLIISRFRKKKTTIEVLEELDSKIKEIQEYGQNTEQKHKKIVGTLIIYSVILYVITAVIFYFYFFPASLYDQLFYITPLLIFPLLIIFTKKMVTWYYKRKISKNHEKLGDMEKEKKKILEQVTETETYKKAKEILLKFAPDQLRMTPLSPPSKVQSPSSEFSLQKLPSTPQPMGLRAGGDGGLNTGGDLRKRALTQFSSPATNTSFNRPASSFAVQRLTFNSATSPLPLSPYQQSDKQMNTSIMQPRLPLPRPILSQQRSYIDRLVEYLVGDGPSNRYALICRHCDAHNGMALKEEFEYFGYRCCYCNYLNPARKQKPTAPKLESNIVNNSLSNLPVVKTSSDEEEISSTSGTDSDIEVVDKPETPDLSSSKPMDIKKLDDIPSQNQNQNDNLSDSESIEEAKETNPSAQSENIETDESP